MKKLYFFTMLAAVLLAVAGAGNKCDGTKG